MIRFPRFFIALTLCMAPTKVVGLYDETAPKADKGKGGMSGFSGANTGNGTVRLLIQYNNPKGKETAKNADIHGGMGGSSVDSTDFPVTSIEVFEAEAEAIAQTLRDNPDIAHVDPDDTLFALHMRGSAEDEINQIQDSIHRELQAESQPYGIGMVNAPGVWNSAGGRSYEKITVCVVDTGYGDGHPDLPNSNQHGVGGWHPNPNNGYGLWNVDGNSHGTHCAGTIGAIGNNGVGVVGVLNKPEQFKFYIGKGLSDQGSGSTSNVMNAVSACVAAGAKVISMSLGGGGASTIVENQYKAHYDAGVLIIAAAGNGGNSAKSYPASYPHVMSVASVDSDEGRSSYSQYNDQVEIAGPGRGVRSTVTSNSGRNFGYATYSGTSMATPHVAGVAALVWSYFPNCSNQQIRNVLLRTARDKGAAGCDVEYGYGIVNAQAAFDLLDRDGCAAGGATPNPISDGSVGGCDQDPDSTLAPTPAPTAFEPCDQKGKVEFKLSLTVDNYPAETSWDLKDKDGNIIAAGGGYNENTPKPYERIMCLDPSKERFTFTMKDSYGDGLCCDYGRGSYSLTYGGTVVRNGAQFGSSEVTTFPENLTPRPDPTGSPVTSSPVMPTSSPVMPTSSPVMPTSSPVVPTSSPVVPTSSPVVSTSSPVVSTSSPVVSTSSPVVSTSSPVVSTPAPVTSVDGPVQFDTLLFTKTNRRLYTVGGNWNRGVGARAYGSRDEALTAPLDKIYYWNFTEIACWDGMEVEEVPTCFTVQNVATGRRLYAAPEKNRAGGFGATPVNYANVGDSQKWYLLPDENNDGEYWLVNSRAARYAYAWSRRDWNSAVGALNRFVPHDGYKWFLPGMPAGVL